MKIYILDLPMSIKVKLLLSALLTLVFFTAGYAQKPDMERVFTKEN